MKKWSKQIKKILFRKNKHIKYLIFFFENIICSFLIFQQPNIHLNKQCRLWTNHQVVSFSLLGYSVTLCLTYFCYTHCVINKKCEIRMTIFAFLTRQSRESLCHTTGVSVGICKRFFFYLVMYLAYYLSYLHQTCIDDAFGHNKVLQRRC